MAVKELNSTDIYVLKAIYNRTIRPVFDLGGWIEPENYQKAKASRNPYVRRFIKKHVLRTELVANYKSDLNFYLKDNTIAKSCFKLDELGLVQVDWLDFVMHDFTAQGVRLTDAGIQRVREMIPKNASEVGTA
ncbi:MAG: hypothetical protein D6675_16230 [Gemmatimonadetes bacterium]|nr:MAG: hypothetical protein D6675_16230 [Gemmatimonadota bacterium]